MFTERGFAPIVVVLIGLIVAAAGVGSFAVLSQRGSSQNERIGTRPVEENIQKQNLEALPPPSVIVPTREPVENKPPTQPAAVPVSKPPVSIKTNPDSHTATTPPPKISPSPNPKPPPPTAYPPSANQKLASIEREITVLSGDGNTISPDHYARLKTGLDEEAASGADPEKIKKLREMLEKINPAKTVSTGESTSPTQQACGNDAPPQLTADFTDLSRVGKITAPGSPSSEGPKGHSFIWTAFQKVPVYAPTDGLLETGAYYTGGDGVTQYILSFRIGSACNFVFRFDHIEEPIQMIRNAFPATARKTEDTRGESPGTPLSFKAGDLLGYTDGNSQSGNWDFGLYGTSKKGALSEYGGTGIHIHSVCWVDFYSPGKQDQYRRLLDGPKLVCSF